jgi:hypothetical protein
LTKNVTNLAASVRQRLADLARQQNEDFGLLFMKYALDSDKPAKSDSQP